MPMPGISESDPRQDQGTDEISGLMIQPMDGPSAAEPATWTSENEEMIITSIRVTDVALALRRVPACCYVVVHHSGLEWRTENKASSVNDNVIEWTKPIPIPSSPLATVRLEVCTSFELQPMLGAGEQLQELTVTVEQLLDRSAGGVSFSLSPRNGDARFSCLSISVAIKQRKCENSDTSISRVSDTELLGELGGATNRGHSSLSRFRIHGRKRELEESIREFELALSLCPVDHPCRTAAQSNLAMAHFILCQVEGTDPSLPFSWYSEALRARPVGHVDRPSILIWLAAAHFVRFEKSRDETEGARAKGLLDEVMQISTAESHERRAAMSMLQLHAKCRAGHADVQSDDQSAAQGNSTSGLTDGDLGMLVTQLLWRFIRFDDLDDLEQAIAILKRLVGSTLVSDGEHGTKLGILGMALVYRFKCLGIPGDLEEAILSLRDAVNLIPDGHPQMPDCLSNLGDSLFTRFQRGGERRDLEGAISSQRNAAGLTPDGHPCKPDRLNSLGNSLFTRFERFGDERDLKDATSTDRDAVVLTPDNHFHKPGRLTCLGNFLKVCFERFGEQRYLEDAISRHMDAINLAPDGHPFKSDCFTNLGNSLSTRFNLLAEQKDLEDAISRYKDAVDLTPDGHPDKPSRLNKLAISFHTRFECFREQRDLEDAISSFRDAIDYTSDSHPQLATFLNNLGRSLSARFERLGEWRDLDDAISRQRDAIDLILDGQPHKSDCLTNLGNSLQLRFERFGEQRDLEDAISSHKRAVDLTPNDHPQKSVRLCNLGNSLKTRFEYFGEQRDLEDAILMLRNAINLSPDGHPDKPRCLNNLGNALAARFELLKERRDLKDAISSHRDAVCLTPDGHLHKHSFLNNLGYSLFTRFEHFEERKDLEDAILTQRDAVGFTPDGHFRKCGFLSNLGNFLRARFERFGEQRDLEDAISTLRNAVDLTPDGHPYKPAVLSKLGNSLRIRFQWVGEEKDLEEAISRHRNAVDLTHDGHPNKPGRLNDLAISLHARFEHFGEQRDLEDAISSHRDVITLTSDGHPQLAAFLGNLGSTLFTRFERFGEERDLQESISRCKDAADLTPDSHPNRPGCLNNFGYFLLTRFMHLGEERDLKEAISKHKEAVDITPDGHPYKSSYLNNLGKSLVARFERSEDLGDMEHAISVYCYAASSPFGPVRQRFVASQRWISCARRIRHHSLLQACSVSIDLFPQLAWIGLSLTRRYSELSRGTDVVREAAAVALELGYPETAVEWLERERSIVWGELLQLRSSHDELASTHPDHAHRLRELSTALDHASSTREQLSSALEEGTHSGAYGTPESLRQEADKHRALAIERDELLREIRSLPGFERFLLQKEFSQLRASAHAGPMVVLNAAESRCDALIVLADVDHAIHVPLSSFTFNQSINLQNTLKSFTRHARKGKPVILDSVNWESTLSSLWKCVVKPVLDALAFSTPGNLSRMFWCPTGPFTSLPFHAAGIYDPKCSQPGHKIFDFVISSYIPSLAILVPSPNPVVAPSNNLRLLVVRQPPSDGLPYLRGVPIELEHVREVVENSPSTCTSLLESSVGTVEEVMALMNEADWVHFACHGIQDDLDSGLCLADQRRLKLRDIIGVSRPRGGLAFLSACQTAKGEDRLSDEAIHIAAGMLFAGYGGVIGTMWSISDALAPVVARDVYKKLFENGTRPDYQNAARALHEAIGRVRDTAPFAEWVPFIHVGL